MENNRNTNRNTEERTFEDMMTQFDAAPSKYPPRETAQLRRLVHTTLVNAYVHCPERLLAGDLVIVNVSRAHLREPRLRTMMNVARHADIGTIIEPGTFDEIVPGRTFGIWIRVFDGATQTGEIIVHSVNVDPVVVFGESEWVRQRAAAAASFVATQTSLPVNVILAGDPSRCQACDAKDPKPKACKRCKRSYYCSTECQKRDWRSHKQYCMADV